MTTKKGGRAYYGEEPEDKKGIPMALDPPQFLGGGGGSVMGNMGKKKGDISQP